MAQEDNPSLPHIHLKDHGVKEKYTSPGGGGGGAVPERDRQEHAQKLEAMLRESVKKASIKERNPEIGGEAPGFYLEFKILEKQKSVLDALDKIRGNPIDPMELVAVRPLTDGSENFLQATVFVPESRREHYSKKIRDYRNKVTKKNNPQNKALVAPLEAIALANVESLFTDAEKMFPKTENEKIWWEIWLRIDGRASFEKAKKYFKIEVKEHSIKFPEREVILAYVTLGEMRQIVDNTNAVAELRLARDTPSFFMEMTGAEQMEWSQELADRIVASQDDAPSVCLLDTGTTGHHPLIKPALMCEEVWDPTWTREDKDGHGTGMSGIAIYGDLFDVLKQSGAIKLNHSIESVKILPNYGKNKPELYGSITATAMGKVEIKAPNKSRAYCLAVTEESDHLRGRPSSWSARIDDLAYGDGDGGGQRFIAISAGNIRKYYPETEYLEQNDLASIESPAQAWNALTVGAFTEKSTISNANYKKWGVMAPVGDLSPSSRTSILWERDWPIKPEVVFEGGNQGVDPSTNHGDHIDDLALLTTFHAPDQRPFDIMGDTSAATAQAARMAAQILAEKPNLWPETVRALIVHSAEWTPAMEGHLEGKTSNKRILLRRYGYGVPNLQKALNSFKNDVTMVVESDLQPFVLEKSKAKTRDMVLHDLPWPKYVLQELGEVQVEMKITLSYFIEPNPGERGWTKRYRYSGHGLRFGVKRSGETINQFRKRINDAVHDEYENETDHDEYENSDKPKSNGKWIIGKQFRHRGSIHSDIWRGTAADLASRHAVGIYPIGGWWREKRKLGRTDRRTRYAMIISLRAKIDVDLYTEIKTDIPVSKEIEI